MIRYDLRGKVLCGTLISILLILTGCNTEPVAEKIDRSQAHEIVVLLNSYGISSRVQKEQRGGSSYSVTVKRGSLMEAISLLEANNLPRPPEESFAEITAEKGLIPSSRRKEALRLDHAIAVELAEMLENHPYIMSAKAVVSLNRVTADAAPGAAIMLQTRKGFKVDHAQLVKIVRQVVPEIAVENVHISATEQLPRTPVSGVVGTLNQNGQVLSIPLVPFLIWHMPAGDLYEACDMMRKEEASQVFCSLMNQAVL